MALGSTPQLRPLGVGELLDQAIRLYRRNFLKFIGIIAVVQIPLTLIQLIVSLVTFGDFFDQLEGLGGGPPDDPLDLFGPSYFAGISVNFLFVIIGFILVQGIATAALTRAVAGSYLGQSLGMIEAYGKIKPVWKPLIGALLLAIVLIVLVIIWTVVPCVGWLTGGGMLVFVFMVIIPLIAPIIVLEHQQAVSSIRRAWDLTRRRFWWVLGFVFILLIFNLLVVSGPLALLSFIFQFVVGSPFDFSASQAIWQTIVQSIIGLIFTLIYLPLKLTAITLMYFDLRIRTEGFDLTLLSESVASPETDIAELTAHAPQPEAGNLITMPEMGYFALIEIGAGGLYLLIIAIFGALAVALIAASGGTGGF